MKSIKKELKKYNDDILSIAYILNFGFAEYYKIDNETWGMNNGIEIAEQVLAESRGY